MNFVWNHKAETSKVHIMIPGEALDWHRHERINPDWPVAWPTASQITYWCHALCKPRVYHFTDLSLKNRVRREEYTFSSEYPKGLPLCGACLRQHTEAEVAILQGNARKLITGE